MKYQFPVVTIFLTCLPVLEVGVIVALVNYIGLIASLAIVATPTMIGLLLFKFYAPRRISPQVKKIFSLYSEKKPIGTITPALRSELVDFVGFFSGAILITLPGFITDIIGLLCLNQIIGRAFAEKVVLRFEWRAKNAAQNRSQRRRNKISS